VAKAASATRDAPREPGTDPVGPKGRRIDTNLGPGSLYPGAGRMVQRSGQPLYVGAMTGRAFGYTQHPNSKDPAKTSTRFAGQFIGIKHDGAILNTNEAYLPGAIERTIKAALDLQEGTGMKSPVPFAVEIWCEPDNRASSSMGFRYGCYDRVEQSPTDPLLMLAYESGLIERPTAQIAAPPNDDGDPVDPETGEIG
jgi:hypothetical protein